MKLTPLFLSLWLAALPLRALAVNVITIGDSLTAEYDVIPDIPGFDELPTDYAKVTVDGWEAMSWVEIAGRLRGRYFNFGGWRNLSEPWTVPRLSGYEYNWAVPGVDASQYRDFVTSSAFSNPFYFAARQPLESQLSDKAQRVVIWLGGNDFRGNYGPLSEGRGVTSFVDALIENLGKVIEFVKGRNSSAQIVICNVPDLGATPSKKAAHPDSLKRARVTAVTENVNLRLGQLAARKGIVVADTYAITAALVRDEPLFFGGVRIVNDKDADNNPRYAFARDGLHPNTALQILNVRAVIRAFNAGYSGGIPNITDADALRLLGIDFNEPFFTWLGRFGVREESFEADNDGDGLTQLVEFAFGLDPTKADASALPVKVGAAVAGLPGNVSVRFKAATGLTRYLTVRAQYSTDGVEWLGVPANRLIANADGSTTAAIPPTTNAVRLRLRVITLPPYGSGERTSSYIRIR